MRWELNISADATQMPASTQSHPQGLWLNLSGGGFRAAIFHFGCLRRLHELGLMRHVVGISATSGGALVAALWAMHFQIKLKGLIDETDRPTERRVELIARAEDAAWPEFESDLLALVRRGVLAPVGLLLSSFSFYAVALLALAIGEFTTPQLGHVAAVSLITAVLLQATVLVSLIRDGALRLEISLLREPVVLPAPKRSLRRARLALLGMALLSPSRLRRYTLELRVFRGFLLKELDLSPVKVFFNAVNLDEGRQAVIGRSCESGIDRVALRRLWQSRAEGGVGHIPLGTRLSEVVGASTAIPPWFRPVPLTIKRQGRKETRSHFIDGGVTDNVAFKLAWGLARYSESPDPEWVDQPWYEPSFKESVGAVFTIDASRPTTARSRVVSRVQAILRLAQVAQNAQMEDLVAVTESLRALDIRAFNVGLQVGFDDEPLERLNTYLTRVRTHLGKFTAGEIGAIAYCGYARIETVSRRGISARYRYFLVSSLTGWRASLRPFNYLDALSMRSSKNSAEVRGSGPSAVYSPHEDVRAAHRQRDALEPQCQPLPRTNEKSTHDNEPSKCENWPRTRLTRTNQN